MIENSFVSFQVLVLVGLMIACYAAGSLGQQSRVSDDQLDSVLNDPRYLTRQIKCALGEAPCDPVGRRLKSTLYTCILNNFVFLCFFRVLMKLRLLIYFKVSGSAGVLSPVVRWRERTGRLWEGQEEVTLLTYTNLSSDYEIAGWRPPLLSTQPDFILELRALNNSKLISPTVLSSTLTTRMTRFFLSNLNRCSNLLSHVKTPVFYHFHFHYVCYFMFVFPCLSELAPLVLQGSCPQCSSEEAQQIKKVLSHIQLKYPKEWSKVVMKYSTG